MPAISTMYDGDYFRSRTEARWAVFFHQMGAAYQYEKQGYNLGAAGYYLPDFWLPGLEIWVEIKAEQPTREEFAKAESLSRETGRLVTVFVGPPPGHGMTFIHIWGEWGLFNFWWGHDKPGDVQWMHCTTCGKLSLFIEDRDGDMSVSLPDLDEGVEGKMLQCCDKWPYAVFPSGTRPMPNKQITTRIENAIETAQRARFEHGETPAVPERHHLS